MNGLVDLHVSMLDAATFRRELDSIRPEGTRQFAKPCSPQSKPGSDDSEYELDWRGGGRADRLLACFNDKPVRRAINRALLVLRVDPDSGTLLNPAEAHKRYESLGKAG